MLNFRAQVMVFIRIFAWTHGFIHLVLDLQVYSQLRRFSLWFIIWHRKSSDRMPFRLFLVNFSLFISQLPRTYPLITKFSVFDKFLICFDAFVFIKEHVLKTTRKFSLKPWFLRMQQLNFETIFLNLAFLLTEEAVFPVT